MTEACSSLFTPACFCCVHLAHPQFEVLLRLLLLEITFPRFIYCRALFFFHSTSRLFFFQMESVGICACTDDCLCDEAVLK